MFCHLHGHSFYSNLLSPDALSSPEEIVLRAKEQGFSAIALTDHASVTGIPDFAKACKKHGVKPVVGAELYVVDDPAWRPEAGAATRKDYVHIVALARNFEGFQELLGLLSTANGTPNFYYKPRNAWADLYATQHLIFTTACAGGLLKRPDHQAKLVEFRDAVGADRLYLEIQPHWDPSQIEINKRAVAASAATGLKLVAAQDFHYANPDDHVTHEVLLCIGSKDVFSNPGRWRYPVSDLYVKSTDQMMQAFLPWIADGILTPDQVLGAFAATVEIAGRTDFQWRTLPISLPDMGANPDDQVLALCAAELKRRGLDGDPVYINRLIYEMDVLKKSGFISYFLVLRDIIAWSRRQGIMVGPGRGSSGGSLVCFLIGITTVDPIRHDLLFERFFRPGRVDLPDIDTDFEDERREEVLAYIRQRFGAAHTANVCAYMSLRAKGAIKDVARVFEIDHVAVNTVTTAITVPDIQIEDAEAEKKHAEAVFADPAVAPFFRAYPHVEHHARKLVGWMRGTGQHAAGVVIAGNPLSQHAVVAHSDGRAIVNWDKRIIEDMGLMKLDVLGLRTLSILRIAAENVFKTRGRKIVYEDIPLDDPKTLALFDRGETTGVFQFESRGMRALLKALNVDRFSVICDAVALYRPGPMDLIPQYETVQTGRAPAYFAHPLMEPILAPTYGVMIYQEQLMRVFVDVGGFDYAHADKMRKIVGKKLGPDEFNKHRDDFVTGALAKGLDRTAAEKIFSDMVAFAGYGFNKSHAVEYSIISFWCGYMKVHFPAEFYAAHLSNSDEEQMGQAVDDALKSGIEVLMPDVTFSDAKRFTVVTAAKIHAPLSAIKGVGDKAAELIVGAREGRLDHQGLGVFDTRANKDGSLTGHDPTFVRNERFLNHEDFLKRIYKRIVNSKVQRLLGEVGALPWALPGEDELIAKRRELLGAIYREVTAVDVGATLLFDANALERLQRLVNEVAVLAGEAKATPAYPAYGSKPRLMLVFEKPEWRDEKHGQLGHGDGFDVARRLLKDQLGLTMRDLYLTSYFRFRNPPLGLDPYEARSAALLRDEIDLLKPPLIIAFGKKPIEFFAGAGTKVNDAHGKIVRHGKTPVVLAISPIQVVMEPDKRTKFETLGEVLKEIYIP